MDINQNEKQSISQRQMILLWLQEGHTLTCLESLRRFGAFDTRKRISELRAEGWPIEDRWIVSSAGKRVKEYYYNDTTGAEGTTRSDGGED